MDKPTTPTPSIKLQIEALEGARLLCVTDNTTPALKICLDAAIATLSSVALIGEKKIQHAAEAFELLKEIDKQAKKSFAIASHLYPEWSAIKSLLSKVEEHKS